MDMMNPGTCLLVPANELPDPEIDLPPGDQQTQSIVLAGGCFWCTEAVFQRLAGVRLVTSGYAGGSAETADYRTVCTGTTGHAEVIRVEYDPRQITLGKILKIFFGIAHDPTTLNRQGADQGTQYRSAIFYDNPEQERIARAYIEQLTNAHVFSRPIVTTLEPLEKFYPAEDYHQNYARENPTQPYVQFTALPKVEKLEKYFKNSLQ